MTAALRCTAPALSPPPSAALSLSLSLSSLLPPLAPPDAAARRLGHAAVVSLYDELALAPKPGLVSFADAGSHTDMDGQTFLRSLFALRHSYPRFVALGAQGADFTALAREGRAAEARMLAATGGINTHRGAIFTLGLLCASGGALRAAGQPLRPDALRRTLVDRWGAALAARGGIGVGIGANGGGDSRAAAAVSHGVQAARTHGLRGANAEAAAGMPVLFDCALPALQQALAAGLPAAAARLQAFFTTLAVLDDTNLAHRGGLDGLHWAQAQARGWLALGGAQAPDAVAQARCIHRAFVQRRLSPGGAADVLAAACWLQRVCGSA
jgi:triphosphoribosyl-dephospho-CoA synthase